MTAAEEQYRHNLSRRLLLYLELVGVPAEESLALGQQILASRPASLGEALDRLEKCLPAGPETVWPAACPPLNRQSMLCDETNCADFFNTLEL
ncbi:MAG: hypothetical protein LBK52_02320 [Deltaproteobacteria bacterium]|jgi:hypothetical protein|nr:hypothetical protein [Deltaproteobacteria bacterium]